MRDKAQVKRFKPNDDSISAEQTHVTIISSSGSINYNILSWTIRSYTVTGIH